MFRVAPDSCAEADAPGRSEKESITAEATARRQRLHFRNARPEQTGGSRPARPARLQLLMSALGHRAICSVFHPVHRGETADSSSEISSLAGYSAGQFINLGEESS